MGILCFVDICSNTGSCSSNLVADNCFVLTFEKFYQIQNFNYNFFDEDGCFLILNLEEHSLFRSRLSVQAEHQNHFRELSEGAIMVG